MPAAVQVLRGYYAAIGARDYHAAYGAWGDEGRSSHQTFEQFAAGFRETASVSLEVGEPGRIDAAAGSRYLEIPVSIRAVTTRGDTQRFAGTYVLRRSEVDGATLAQRHWHIDSASLKSIP